MTQKPTKAAVKTKAPVGMMMVRRFWLMNTAEVFMTAVAILMLLKRQSTIRSKMPAAVQLA